MRVVKLFLFIYSIITLSCVSKSQTKIEVLKILSEHKLRAPTIINNQYFGLRENDNSFNKFFYNPDSLFIKEVNVLSGKVIIYSLRKHFNRNYINNNQLKDLCKIGKDSLFLLFEEEIACINSYKIFQRKKINEFKNGKWPRHTIDGYDGVWKSTLDKNNHSILLKSISADILYYYKNYFEKEILVSYNYLSNEIEVKKVYFPNYYRNNFVGDMRTFSALQLEEFVLISFSAINLGIKYNSKQIENIKLAQSTIDQVEVKWLEWGKDYPLKLRRDNIIQNRIYDNVIYNNGYYYQFYRDNISLKDKDGNFNSMHDKKIFLIKMDNSFNYLKEYALPTEHTYDSYDAFVFENKIYIHNTDKNANNKDFIFYDVFDLFSLQ